MSNTLWLSLPGITGEPKVTDLERHVSVEEHVAQLEVPVENPLQVNVPRKQVPVRTVTVHNSRVKKSECV
jgi:hypothetical protein